MNTDRRLPSHLYDGDAVVRDMLVDFQLSLFGMEHVNYQPSGNKGSENQPMEKRKKIFRLWTVKFRLNLVIYYPRS
jgi:hypothetical protein